jgi:hypothetical protein
MDFEEVPGMARIDKTLALHERTLVKHTSFSGPRQPVALLQNPQDVQLLQPIKPFHTLAPIVILIPIGGVRMRVDHVLQQPSYIETHFGDKQREARVVQPQQPLRTLREHRHSDGWL